MINHYIPVSNRTLLLENGVYLAPATLRKWHHLGIHANLFLKITNKLMLDLTEWAKLVDSAIQTRTEKLKRFQKLGMAEEENTNE